VTLLAVLLPGRCMQRKKLKPATWNNRQPGDAELLQPRSNMPGDRLSQELAHRTDSPLPPRRLARAAVPHLLIGAHPDVSQGTACFEPLLNILEPQVSKFDHAVFADRQIACFQDENDAAAGCNNWNDQCASGLSRCHLIDR